MKFEKMKNENDLIKFLKDEGKFIRKCDKVFHYTSIENAKKIIEGGLFYLNLHIKQNDMYEYNRFSKKAWDCIYSASFTVDNNENIALWFVYAKDRGETVRLEFPAEKFKNWINKIEEVRIGNDDNKFLTIDEFECFRHKVLYREEPKELKQKHMIYCGGQETEWKLNEYDYNALAGFVKDSAWQYEKELRVRIQVKEDIKAKCLIIPIEEDLLNSIKIMIDPWYDNKFLSDETYENFLKNMDNRKRLEHSKFQGKIFEKNEQEKRNKGGR